MKKYKLEAKVNRLSLTLSKSTFVLIKGQPLVLMLDDVDISIVIKSKYILVTEIDKVKVKDILKKSTKKENLEKHVAASNKTNDNKDTKEKIGLLINRSSDRQKDKKNKSNKSNKSNKKK